MLHYGHLVRILHCCTSQTMTEALSSMDLTSAQGHVVGFLAHCENPPCARDIEEAFHLSHPTVSGLLSRLEKKEFLELRPDPEDRRCKRIYMLPKGRECIEIMDRTILNNEERFVQGFTREEKEILFNFVYEKDLVKEVSDILTDFEAQVFELKINGFDYKEIAEILDKDIKAIDNALQRIKVKIKKLKD